MIRIMNIIGLGIFIKVMKLMILEKKKQKMIYLIS